MAAMMLLVRPVAPSSLSTSVSFPGGITRKVGIHARSLRCSERQILALGRLTPLLGLLTSSSSPHARGRWEKKEVPVEGRPLAPSLPTPRSPPRRICHCAGTSAEGDSSGSSEDGDSLIRGVIVRAGEVLSMGFPLWVASACVLALLRPSSFLWVHTKWQIIGLTITMLGMGMTLTLDDLRNALLMPRELLVGFLLQYTVMPFSGYIVSKLLKLPSYYAAGLILVACCPGGTASNIVTYLANGNVALSVLMTAASTFASVVMTPFLTSRLAGQFVALDPAGLFISTVQVVLAPVLLGALLNQYCSNFVEFVSPLMPFITVATVAILCGSAIAQNASSILSSGLQVLIATCSLHASGFFFGYALARLLRLDESSSRTVSIEVGMQVYRLPMTLRVSGILPPPFSGWFEMKVAMHCLVQNSVLGVVLAGQHFGNPLTAVPCAVSSVCHSVFGSVLARIWRSKPAVAKRRLTSR